MTATWADNNPNMPDAENMDHWKVVLKRGKKQMTTYFSMGYGHKGQEPTAADVLDCLASDAASYENCGRFEDWASNMGYDTDSRKAERTFKTIGRQTFKLYEFLGSELYGSILWETERL